MKQMKLSYMLVCVMLFSIFFTACGKDVNEEKKENNGISEMYFGGGDIVKYSYIIRKGGFIQSSIPLITNVEIDQIEFVSVECTNDATLEIELINGTEDKINEEHIEYKGYYAYFPAFRISMVADGSLDTSIEAFNMLINGNEVRLEFADFHIIDKVALGEKYSAIVDEGDLSLESPITVVWPKLPSPNSIGGRSVEEEYSCEYDVEILQYEFTGNFVTFDSFYCGGRTCSNDSINTAFSANSMIPIKYQLNYAEGVSSDNIVRETYVIKYTCANQTYLATSVEMCVWDDWNELNSDDVMGPVKRFIDKIQK